MKKIRKFFALSVAACLLLSLMVVSSSSADIEPPLTTPNEPVLRPPVDTSGMPVQEIIECPAYQGIYEFTGFYDYVFVARVISMDGTEYRWPSPNPDGTISYLPYTHYTIEVLENIKGELRLGEMRFVKGGGLLYDRDIVELGQGDFLPEPGWIFIFYANADENGVLGCGGRNCTVILTDGGPSVFSWLGKLMVINEAGATAPATPNPNLALETIHQLSEYEWVIHGVENQKVFEKPWVYVAEYDVANEAVKDNANDK
ncbi:MAG: hypothetical protein LBO63_02185 [Oscillospiraceae bacterium]|jgi:hypothetical protein|nr:hypothetical protein [Oscillospiraceae bacterium]